MRSITSLFVVTLVLFVAVIPQVASADDSQLNAKFLLSLKHDIKVPQDGPNKGQEVTADKVDGTLTVNVSKAVLGFEIQHLMAQSANYYQTRYTWLAGIKDFPVTWVGGYITDGTKEYCHSGIYYGDVLSDKIITFVDSQVYWKIDGKSPGYWDTYASAYWKFGKFQTGPDLGYDYWYEGPKHQWFLYGLVARYPVSDRALVGIRVANMNDRLGGNSINTAATRLYLNISF